MSQPCAIVKGGQFVAAAAGDVVAAETYDATAGYTKSGSALAASDLTQNATGTSSATFQVGSAASGPKLKNATGDLQVCNAGDSAYAPLDCSELKIGGASMVSSGGAAKVQAAVAGSGLAHNAGALDVSVDGATLEINSDTLRIKDAGVSGAKLASAVAQAVVTHTASAGAEGVVGSDVIRVTLQAKDAAGNNLAQRCLVYWWISDAQWSQTASSAPSVAYNDGVQIESIEGGTKFQAMTDAAGKLTLDVTVSGNVSVYLQSCIGSVVLSTLLDFDSIA